MTIYHARIVQEPGGAWVASAVEIANCRARAATRDAALERLRDEIRYRLEYCPCSTLPDDHVSVEPLAGVGDEASSGASDEASPPAAAAPPPGSRRGWKRWDD